MGIDVNRGHYMRPAQPKAIVGRTLSNELVAKTLKLFESYEEIPLNVFSILYSDTYGEVLDASSLAFDNGLLGFLRQLQTIRIEETDKGYMCRHVNRKRPINGESLHNLQQVPITKIESIKPTTSENDHWKKIRQVNPNKRQSTDWLFDPDDTYLWHDRYGIRNLLDQEQTDFIPASSPLEMALQRDHRRVQSEVSKINQVMSRFPSGIRLSEVCTYVDINKRLFNIPSIDTMVHEFPELFFVDEPREDGEDKIVYSGRTTTEKDLSGSLFKPSSFGEVYSKTMIQLILTGLYQKTLLLIRSAGPEGLKLASWRQSIKNNFKSYDRYEDLMLGNDPVSMFRAMAYSGLIKIRSPENCKNDLRVLLPTRRIKFDLFMSEYRKRCKIAKNKNKMECWNRIISYCPVELNPLYSPPGSSVGVPFSTPCSPEPSLSTCSSFDSKDNSD